MTQSEETAPIETKLTFASWLEDQLDRPDPVGELARSVAEMDPSRLRPGRKADEHKMWADFVTLQGDSQHVLAFNDAWREFLQAQ